MMSAKIDAGAIIPAPTIPIKKLGRPAKADKTTPVSCRIDDDEKAALELLASRHGMTEASLIRRALNEIIYAELKDSDGIEKMYRERYFKAAAEARQLVIIYTRAYMAAAAGRMRMEWGAKNELLETSTAEFNARSVNVGWGANDRSGLRSVCNSVISYHCGTEVSNDDADYHYSVGVKMSSYGMRKIGEIDVMENKVAALYALEDFITGFKRVTGWMDTMTLVENELSA